MRKRKPSRERTAERLARRLCRACGRAPAEPGRRECAPCAETRRARQRQRYREEKAAGKHLLQGQAVRIDVLRHRGVAPAVGDERAVMARLEPHGRAVAGMPAECGSTRFGPFLRLFRTILSAISAAARLMPTLSTSSPSGMSSRLRRPHCGQRRVLGVRAEQVAVEPALDGVAHRPADEIAGRPERDRERPPEPRQHTAPGEPAGGDGVRRQRAWRRDTIDPACPRGRLRAFRGA